MRVYAIVALVSYLLGSIPFGYILVRLFLKTDVRTLGSGNIGATNVGRTGHRGLAISTLLLDAGKGALAVWIAQDVARYHILSLPGFSRDYAPWVLSLPFIMAAGAALFAVLGHVFPVWLKFRGGKGVATAVGAFAFVAPQAVLVALVVFLVVVATTRFVSLGSILAAVAFPFALYWLRDPWFDPALPTVLALISATSALVILKHHQNIRRILSGTESKLGAKAPLPENPVETEKNA